MRVYSLKKIVNECCLKKMSSGGWMQASSWFSFYGLKNTGKNLQLQPRTGNLRQPAQLESKHSQAQRQKAHERCWLKVKAARRGRKNQNGQF
jgi:hypothetical protein